VRQGKGGSRGSPAARSQQLRAAADPGPSDDTLAAAFSAFDSAGVGHIPVECLSKLMTKLGFPLGPDQARQATAQLDQDGLGTVNYDEFLLWWKG
jgi:Ca2+-binding EF-hand superfamily protein